MVAPSELREYWGSLGIPHLENQIMFFGHDGNSPKHSSSGFIFEFWSPPTFWSLHRYPSNSIIVVGFRQIGRPVLWKRTWLEILPKSFDHHCVPITFIFILSEFSAETWMMVCLFLSDPRPVSEMDSFIYWFYFTEIEKLNFKNLKRF